MSNYKVILIRILAWTFCSLAILSVTGCKSGEEETNSAGKGGFEIKAKYDSIRSCPGGGGLFVFYIHPGQDLTGSINLSIVSDQHLGASLNKNRLSKTDSVAELTILPDLSTEVKKYQVRIIAKNDTLSREITLSVDVINWPHDIDSEALIKRNLFSTWIEAHKPEYINAFAATEMLYNTYPQIIIVEHYTFLTPEWELRFCTHVMVPPDDWSMIRIRKRSAVEAEFAAKLFTDGTIQEIPVSDYPVMIGY